MNPQRGFALSDLRNWVKVYPKYLDGQVASYRLVRGPAKSGLWWTLETRDELQVDIIAVTVLEAL